MNYIKSTNKFIKIINTYFLWAKKHYKSDTLCNDLECFFDIGGII